MLEARDSTVFSGMPIPTFVLSAKEEQELVDRIVSEPAQISSVADPMENLGLGYRGVIIRQIKTDTACWSTIKRPQNVPMAVASLDALTLYQPNFAWVSDLWEPTRPQTGC